MAESPVVAAAIPVAGSVPEGRGGVAGISTSDESVAAAAIAAPSGVFGDRLASIECLAAAIGYEAGNEPEAGKQAVAQVILNRVRHRAFPKSVCGVVYQGSGRRTGCQFTFTCDGSLRRPLSRRTLAAAQSIATAAVDGLLPTTVGIATHYHADYVQPRWAPAMNRVGQIGAHIFYNFPKAASGSGSSLAAAIAGAARSGRLPAPVFTVWGLVPTATITGAGDGAK